MSHNRCAFIVPTKDRAQCIDYYLEKQGEFLEHAGFDIIICDSSENSATKDAVDKHGKRLSNVIYDFYTEKRAVKHIDDKGFELCKKYCDAYEYIWLCSDGTCFDMQRVLPVVLKDLADKKDFVVLSGDDSLPQKDLEFCDAKELCTKLCWRMTLLGSVITSGKILHELVTEFPYDAKNWKNRLWLPTAYFDLLAQIEFTAAYHYIENAYCANPFKKGSFWMIGKNLIWQWGLVWCKSVDSLPEYYASVKEEVILSHDRYSHVFDESRFELYKKNGNLTRFKVLYYRKYLYRVTGTPFLVFLKYAFSPFEYKLLSQYFLCKAKNK